MSNSKTKREIECLTRLQALTGQLGDIIDFLKLERLVSENEIKSLQQSADHPKEVQALLKALKDADKFQLIQYEWVLLPVEVINLTIITDQNTKNFVFNGG